MIIEYFKPEFLALQEELKNHPKLQKLLANHSADEFELKLGEIAAYCKVIMDGYYTPEALQKLAGILTMKLQEKGKIILLRG